MTPELPHHTRLTATGDRLYLAVQMREYGKLVEAATREECARVCRNLIANQGTSDSIKAAKEVANLCAEAIEEMK